MKISWRKRSEIYTTTKRRLKTIKILISLALKRHCLVIVYRVLSSFFRSSVNNKITHFHILIHVSVQFFFFIIMLLLRLFFRWQSLLYVFKIAIYSFLFFFHLFCFIWFFFCFSIQIICTMTSFFLRGMKMKFDIWKKLHFCRIF